MFNFKAIALAATVAITGFVGTAAEARPTRIECDMIPNGTEYCFAPIGRTGVRININNQYDRTGFIAVGDCATGQYRWRANDGYTKAQIGEIFDIACS